MRPLRDLLKVSLGRFVLTEQPVHGSDGHELLIDRLAGALSAPFVEQRVK
jgi:hypothetical protein